MSIAQAFDFLIQWHLTERCNLRCKHCYQDNKKIEEIACETGATASAVKSWRRGALRNIKNVVL